MGEVYLAHDTRIDRKVALKILPADVGGEDRVRRFVQEAKAASALNHPNIATIYGLDKLYANGLDGTGRAAEPGIYFVRARGDAGAWRAGPRTMAAVEHQDAMILARRETGEVEPRPQKVFKKQAFAGQEDRLRALVDARPDDRPAPRAA